MRDDQDILERLLAAWAAPERVSPEELRALLSGSITEISLLRALMEALPAELSGEIEKRLFVDGLEGWSRGDGSRND